jgi:hypothetical protein
MSRNAALRRENYASDRREDIQDWSSRADAFAQELTELCLKHGIGIAGTPPLFVMEAEDASLRYVADDNGNLVIA